MIDAEVLPPDDLLGVPREPDFLSRVEDWREMIAELDHAFEPVANIHTGHVFGYTAHLRHCDLLGYADCAAFFEACWRAGRLPEASAPLIERALDAFAERSDFRQVKLFLDLDARAVTPFMIGHLRHLLGRWDIPESNVVLTLTETQTGEDHAREMLALLQPTGLGLCLKDFGAQTGSLGLLHSAQLGFLRIDGDFRNQAAKHSRKKLFLDHVANLAHLLGVLVIADGLSNEEEYRQSKLMGCDLASGPLIAGPTPDIASLPAQYSAIERLSRSERRGGQSDQRIITAQIQSISPITINTPMLDVFERFRNDKSLTFFPVVNRAGEPLGIIHERDLKDYTYSLYGKELISNRTLGRKLDQFLTRCPVADINTNAEKILEIFSTGPDSEGVIIVENMRYAGFLSARSLLNVINEKNLANARDQNPLTKLPGNNVIHDYVAQELANASATRIFVYFDFDNFKPFNDKFGFRLGDRAILMFAELLRKTCNQENVFIAHIGGDDFFAGFRGFDFSETHDRVAELLAAFRRDAESFYDEESRRSGFVTASGRDGVMARFPLLAVSAALLELPEGRAGQSSESISTAIAGLKKAAKSAEDRISALTISH